MSTNTMMDRMLGRRTAQVEEDCDQGPLPVIANLTNQTFRSRNRKFRQLDPDKDEADDSESDSVKRVLGEASDREETVIPDDAEELDGSETTVGKPLKAVKEIVQEPSYPANKEKYQTPYAALTAPDVTPQAMQPIDPSEVPGRGVPERFTSADLDREEPANDPNTAANAMNILLGRNRPSKPATRPGEFEQAGSVTTEEQAAALLGIQTPLQEEAATKAASALVSSVDGGGTMPPPAPASDGAKVYNAFRRFAG